MQPASSWKLLRQTTFHFTPHLHALNWLPINARIKYKLCSLCFGAITSTGPVYLSNLLKIYTPSRQLQSPVNKHILCIPSVNTKSYGERSFSYTAPTLWNTLPKDIWFSQSLSEADQATWVVSPMLHALHPWHKMARQRVKWRSPQESHPASIEPIVLHIQLLLAGHVT